MKKMTNLSSVPQQNHLAKQLPRKLSSPRQDGISQHHRLFKMCISCTNHLVRTSAPTQGRYHSTDCSCQSERINKINFLFIDCGDWCHRAHHTTKCSQQLQQESKIYVHTIKKVKVINSGRGQKKPIRQGKGKGKGKGKITN